MVGLKHSAMLVPFFALASATGLCQLKTDTAPRLQFEVASVKPSNPNADGGIIKPLPGGQTYVATNIPVKLMIRLMFHLNNRQISGGPGWLETDPYDVEAKADGPHTIDELHVMFQNLLIDRFRLQFHTEMRTLPAYELVVDKSGPKLKENHSPEHFDIPITPAGFGKLEATHCSMSYFAWTLSNRLDQPVIDQTRLAQFYDFKLEWTLSFLPVWPADQTLRLSRLPRMVPTSSPHSANN